MFPEYGNSAHMVDLNDNLDGMMRTVLILRRRGGICS
jgi:hypothetical protein